MLKAKKCYKNYVLIHFPNYAVLILYAKVFSSIYLYEGSEYTQLEVIV